MQDRDRVPKFARFKIEKEGRWYAVYEACPNNNPLLWPFLGRRYWRQLTSTLDSREEAERFVQEVQKHPRFFNFKGREVIE